MSGHSKWHSIKHKKGAADAKRGKIFTRLIKELSIAARAGGGDPDMNPRLRTIVAEAKASNMPRENIDRAIRRGTGQEPGVSYEEAQYEAYGPGGAALIIEVLTDNKNRTAGEIRHLVELRHFGEGDRGLARVKIFGIDPGSGRTGYGCIESDGSRHRVVICGAISSPASASFADKLLRIHTSLAALIAESRPDCVAIE